MAQSLSGAVLVLGACSPETLSNAPGPSSTGPHVVAGTAGTPVGGQQAGGVPGGVAGRGPLVPTFPMPGTAGTPSLPMGAAGTMSPAGVAGGAAPTVTAGGPAPVAGQGAGGAPAPVAGSGGPTVPVEGAGMPKLPAVSGMCPQFNDGTIMVAGHGGVQISAGSKSSGGALLFYWHGTGGSAGEANRQLPQGVRSEITSGGGIIASFNGSRSAGTGRDCSGTGAHNQADFDAADQIAACAVMNHGIDAHRIYTTGCSAGGLQSGCMAQMRSSYIAAAAPNSGGVVFPQAWQDASTPAIFTMHGGSSDVVIVTFSETSATLDMSAKQHGSFVVNCNHGGGHCLAPSALQTAAWQFMKDHPFGFGTSPWASSIPSGVPDYCKVF